MSRTGVQRWDASTLLSFIRQRFSPFGTESLPYPASPFALTKEEDVADIKEAKGFFLACPWNWLYDVLEDVAGEVRSFEKYNNHWSAPKESLSAARFRDVVNAFFVHEGIGWSIDEKENIVARADAAFEDTLRTALSTLEEDKKPTAAEHLSFAIDALSARPKPNTSGAVSHATSAVECVLGEITGATMTLGKYLDRNPGLFHAALKKGIDGIYGYASDQARHGKEGAEPTREDAEFVVATCAATCTLLTKKHSR